MRFSYRRLLTALGTVFIVAVLYSVTSGNSGRESIVLRARRQEITEAFQHAWNGYSQHCMGHDSIHPVSNTCDDDFGGWGATAVDTLSTAIMFEQESIVLEILRFIATIDFTVVAGGTSIQLFEVTIRHFGAMLSAHDLLDGPFKHVAKDETLREALRSQMIALGNVLSCGFSTPSGIPRNWVDPALCTTDSGTSNTVAGAGSLILEFARLSDITGHQVYVERAKKAMQYLVDPQPEEKLPFPGILGSFVSVNTGKVMDSKGSWGSLADCMTDICDKC